MTHMSLQESASFILKLAPVATLAIEGLSNRKFVNTKHFFLHFWQPALDGGCCFLCGLRKDARLNSFLKFLCLLNLVRIRVLLGSKIPFIWADLLRIGKGLRIMAPTF